jgi:hypothetical protein
MRKPPIAMPDGNLYRNTVLCQSKLIQAARDARYLGLIPANAIIDRKNPAPSLYLHDDDDTGAEIEVEPGEIEREPFSTSYSAPTISLPSLVLHEPTVSQRYHLEIWIEKSTMNDVVMPLGKEYGVNVATFEGDTSVTACEDLIRRAIASRKPVRIFYVSDFDPRGNKMPVGAARKIDFLAKTSEYDLDIRVIPVAVTLQQCIDYELPRTPIKDSDECASEFEARFGEGATELDALSEDQLREILVAAIEPYIDDDLDDEVEEMASEVRADLRRIETSVSNQFATQIATLNRQREAISLAFQAVHDPARVAYDEACRQARIAFEAAVAQVRDEIAGMEQAFVMQAEPIIARINAAIEAATPDPDQFDWPEPAEADEDNDPLYDSSRSYLEQVARFRRYRGDDDDDPILKRRRNGSNSALTILRRKRTS